MSAAPNPRRATRPAAAHDAPHAALSAQRVGELLGAWMERELAIISRFPECAGLTVEDREDLYQEVVKELLTVPFNDEEHLRRRLRLQIKRYALNTHRDRGRRRRKLELSAPELDQQARLDAEEQLPERRAVKGEDLQVLAEFIAELSPLERRILRAVSQDPSAGYNRLAARLHEDVNEVRTALSSFEQKQERFLLIYRAGRLCGYRARTITALKQGHASSEQANLALTHLRLCARCRTEHDMSHEKLRRDFQHCAAILALPAPMLLHHALWSTSTAVIRARRVGSRFITGPPGGVRERLALLLTDRANNKLAMTATGVALLTGVGITTHALTTHNTHHDPRATQAQTLPQKPPRQTQPATEFRPTITTNKTRIAHHTKNQHKPLARVVTLPATTPNPPLRQIPTPPTAHQAKRSPATQPTPSSVLALTPRPRESPQHGGGPFSP